MSEIPEALNAVAPEQIGLHESLHPIWTDLDPPLQIATALVAVCHHGADGELRGKMAKTWWSQFLPSRVILAAKVSSSLSAFCAELAQRLQGQIGATNDRGGEQHRTVAAMLFALDAETHEDVLDVLESQAVVCATIIRASGDAWWKERRAESGEPRARKTTPEEPAHGDEEEGEDDGEEGDREREAIGQEEAVE